MYHAIITNQQKHGRLRKPRSDETPVPFLPVLGVSAPAALFLLFHALVNYSAPHPNASRLVPCVRPVRCGSTSGTDDGLLRAWALYWAASRPDCSTFCSHDEVR